MHEASMGSWSSHEGDSFLVLLSSVRVLSHDASLNKRHSHHLALPLLFANEITHTQQYRQHVFVYFTSSTPLSSSQLHANHTIALGLQLPQQTQITHTHTVTVTPSNMCDYTQREYSCGHFRWIASKWCKDYTLTHKRCQPNVTHFEYR